MCHSLSIDDLCSILGKNINIYIIKNLTSGNNTKIQLSAQNMNVTISDQLMLKSHMQYKSNETDPAV